MLRNHRLTPYLAGLLLALGTVAPAWAGDATIAGTASAEERSSTWIAVESPLTGDDNRNGWSEFEIATASGGPFDLSAATWGRLPGPSEWRADVLSRGVAPGSTYFVRVTYHDPDGVSGPNPQVLGPITTPSSAPFAVTVEAATAEARDDEIFVRVPIRDDADRDSYGTVEVAAGPSGPWARKCGGSPGANLIYHPLACRIRSLVPGTDYWVRATVSDGDGVAGPNPQVLGPIRYEGAENLALGRPITADPGWACCPSPSQLVDGRIQNDAWFFGFAWTGGGSGWAGGSPGFKHATVDLGAPTRFDRAVVWYHDPGNVPVVWKFQHSDDGSTWTDAVSVAEPVCRSATIALPGYWGFPACGHDATFAPVTARYFRYTFDDRTLFGGIHGWAVEIEVFDSGAFANEPPTADAGADQSEPAADDCLAEVALDGTGSSDPDGDPLTYAWSGPFGTAAGATPTVTLPAGVHAVELTVDDGRGGTDTDEVVITVEDVTPPPFADVPADATAECAGPAGTAVTLAPPTATDACDGPVPVTSDAPALFPFGATTVTFTATDAAGNEASVEVVVTVEDTTPPDVTSLAATPHVLWPPNHTMRPVSVEAEAADACEAAAPACALVAVTSDEPVDGVGDGSISPDWEIVGDLAANLRAERSGAGDGRVYTLEVVCADGSGNAAAGTAAVAVPRDLDE